MINRAWVFMCFTGFCTVPVNVGAANIGWPALPKDCFVSGRPATFEDVKTGCAAFVIGKAGMPAGTPLDIKVPQYAWHVDQGSGKKAPVILVQAEESSGIKAVGFRNLDTRGLEAALLTEMVLLGTEKPAQSDKRP